RVRERPDLLALTQDIQKAQDFLLQLYQEVQSYAAPVKLRREQIDVEKTVADVWKQLEAQRKRRSVRLMLGPRGHETDLVFDGGSHNSRTCSIWGDAAALGQVFRNIVENALGACSDPVVLRVSWTDTVLAAKPAVALSFFDNGPGFASDTLDKVFQPFFST